MVMRPHILFLAFVALCSATRFEVENAMRWGDTPITRALPGFSGAGHSTTENAIFTVFAEKDMDTQMNIRYALRFPSEMILSINGIKQGVMELVETNNVWSNHQVMITLRSGLNTVSLQQNSLLIQLDYVDIVGVVAKVGTAHGASLPYVTYEAENGQYKGQLLPFNVTLQNLAAECSNRKGVKLQSQGDYVSIKITSDTNAVAVRVSIPDSSDGVGINATLSLYVNGAKNQVLQVTSVYSWYYGGYPYNGQPASGNAHHMYDEVRATLGSTVSSGANITVQIDSGDTAPWYAIDLIDTYNVPKAYSPPSGAVNIVDKGADPTGKTDSTSAINAAISAAGAGGTVWVPSGQFLAPTHIILNNVNLRGAGPWYSFLIGKGIGVYGLYVNSSGPSKNVGIYDLAIRGEVKTRDDDDQVNGVGGALTNSVVQNLFIQHTKVGMWFDGPMDSLLLTGNIIRDLTADGINMHTGCSNIIIEQNGIRNSGDDGIALWSEKQPDFNVQIRSNSVGCPNLANNIAIYGGHDNTVNDCYVNDQLWQGGGVQVAGNRFGSVPLSGTTTITNSTLQSTGNLDASGWTFSVGALWFYGPNTDGKVVISNLEILSSPYTAVQFIEGDFSNLSFNNITVTDVGTFVWQLQSNMKGTIDNFVAGGKQQYGQYSCGCTMTYTGSGDLGWNTTHCGWLDPIY